MEGEITLLFIAAYFIPFVYSHFSSFFFQLIINLFFREIRPRGAHNIPKDGPLIVVVAPHHNQVQYPLCSFLSSFSNLSYLQFLDGIILMSEVQAASGRRLSILTAEHSMQRKFIGASARLLKASM